MDGIRPLTSVVWRNLLLWLEHHELQPAALLDRAGDVLEAHNAQRVRLPVKSIVRLLSRDIQFAVHSEAWDRAGLWVMTYWDDHYPEKLRRRPVFFGPPIFFGCGDRSLVGTGELAVLGSRKAHRINLAYAESLGQAAARSEATIVSGGVEGVDASAVRGALTAGGRVIQVLSHNLLHVSRDASVRPALKDGRLVLISTTAPTVRLARVDVGRATRKRDDYIYVLSDAAVVAHYDRKKTKGGVVSGAKRNLQARWVPLWVRRSVLEHPDSDPLIYLGAKELLAEENPQDHVQQILTHARAPKGFFTFIVPLEGPRIGYMGSAGAAPPMEDFEPSQSDHPRMVLARPSSGESNDVVDPAEEAILLLTTEIEEDGAAQPLSPQEWVAFEHWLRAQRIEPEKFLSDAVIHLLQEADVTSMPVDMTRIRALMGSDRRRLLSDYMTWWKNLNVWIVHCRERDYPQLLKDKFKQDYPAVLFGFGCRDILARQWTGVAVACSGKSDLEYANALGRELAKNEFTVVTRGDSDPEIQSIKGAVDQGGLAIKIQSGGLGGAAGSRRILNALATDRFVILSELVPGSRHAKKASKEYRRHSELVYGCSAAGIVIRCGKNDAVKKGAVHCLNKELTRLWACKTSGSNSTSIQAIAKKGEGWLPDGQDAVSHVYHIRRTLAPNEISQRGLF